MQGKRISAGYRLQKKDFAAVYRLNRKGEQDSTILQVVYDTGTYRQDLARIKSLQQDTG